MKDHFKNYLENRIKELKSLYEIYQKDKNNTSLPEWQNTLAREMQDCVKMSYRELEKALNRYNDEIF